MDDVALIPYLARIQFGYGARRLLLEELNKLGIKRPLVFTDRGVRSSGVLDIALEALTGRLDYEVFDAVSPEPTAEIIRAAVERYRSAGCDGVVGVGGGATLDTMKGVALLATHPAPLDRYRADRGGTGHIGPGIAPMVALTTTAGSGSDLGTGMGIALQAHRAKAVFYSPYLVPKVAICDPELTLRLPAAMTAGTGIDAFSHALEGFLSPAVNPPAEAIALDALARLWRHLETAVRDGGDRRARWEVMMGATEAGMRMGKGLGPAHALSIPLDTLGLHHGTLVGVLLPATIAFVAAAAPEKMARIRTALGLAAEADVSAALMDFNRRIGLPSGLRAMGVADAALEAMAHDAAASVFNQSGARRGSAADYLALARAAMG